MSSKSTSGLRSERLFRCLSVRARPPPAKAKTRMPADFPASMPPDCLTNPSADSPILGQHAERARAPDFTGGGEVRGLEKVDERGDGQRLADTFRLARQGDATLALEILDSLRIPAIGYSQFNDRRRAKDTVSSTALSDAAVANSPRRRPGRGEAIVARWAYLRTDGSQSTSDGHISRAIKNTIWITMNCPIPL